MQTRDLYNLVGDELNSVDIGLGDIGQRQLIVDNISEKEEYEGEKVLGPEEEEMSTLKPGLRVTYKFILAPFNHRIDEIDANEDVER